MGVAPETAEGAGMSPAAGPPAVEGEVPCGGGADGKALTEGRRVGDGTSTVIGGWGICGGEAAKVDGDGGDRTWPLFLHPFFGFVLLCDS